MKTIGMILCLATLAGCIRQPGKKTQVSDLLVFRGTVTSIVTLPMPQSIRNWVITMRVDQVEKGQFGGSQFSFRVHSPVKSGLHVNGAYRVEATLTQDGYVLDEFQWNR